MQGNFYSSTNPPDLIEEKKGVQGGEREGVLQHSCKSSPCTCKKEGEIFS